MFPGRTPYTVHNDPIGAKKAKERITINACANAAGTIKLLLLFIGINEETLPVIYRYQKKNACVHATNFKDWLQSHFVPMAKEKLIELGVEPKVLLVMDNCSAHPSEEELNTDGRYPVFRQPSCPTAQLSEICRTNELSDNWDGQLSDSPLVPTSHLSDKSYFVGQTGLPTCPTTH